MNKVLIEVYLPVVDKGYDMFVPLNLMLYDVLKMICKVAMELSNGLFIAGEDTVLCSCEDGAILNINLSVEELGLQNGSKLMLI